MESVDTNVFFVERKLRSFEWVFKFDPGARWDEQTS